MNVYYYNFILYLLIFLYSLFIYKRSKIFTIIWGVYTFSSLTTIYFISGIEYDFTNNQTIMPLIYIFVNILLTTWPFLKLDLNKVRYSEIIKNIQSMYFLDKLPTILFIILLLPTFENLLIAITMESATFDMIYNRADSSQAAEAIFTRLSFYSRYANKLIDFIFYIIPILLFRELIKVKLNRRNIVFLSFIILDILLTAYTYAARTEFVKVALCVLGCYIFFHNAMPLNRIKTLNKVLLLSISFVFCGLAIITFSRFSASSGTYDLLTWLSLYTGEGFFRFTDLMWYKNDVVMMGDDNFPFFKNLIGLPTFTNGFQRREFWEPKLGVPNNIFYTYIGNFVADFGFIITMIISLLIGLYINKIIKKIMNVPRFYHFIILLIFFIMITFGIMHFPYKVYNDQMRLVGLLVLSMYGFYNRYKYI
ncbi:conserved domain protein [Prevotella sp. CAG:1058]|nr:conserved domain protein [Prevotella sp. CAG:1058]